jgi:hypothetical protein
VKDSELKWELFLVQSGEWISGLRDDKYELKVQGLIL